MVRIIKIKIKRIKKNNRNKIDIPKRHEETRNNMLVRLQNEEKRKNIFNGRITCIDNEGSCSSPLLRYEYHKCFDIRDIPVHEVGNESAVCDCGGIQNDMVFIGVFCLDGYDKAVYKKVLTPDDFGRTSINCYEFKPIKFKLNNTGW